MNAVAEFTHRIAPLLWAVSWQVTLLVALVALVSLTCRRASAAFRYGLWCIVLARLFVPVSLTLPLGMSRAVREHIPVAALRTAALPEPLDVAPRPAASVTRPAALRSVQTPAAVPTAPAIHFNAYGLAWLLIAAAIAIAQLGRFFKINRLVRNLPGVERPELAALVDELRRRAGLDVPVTLRYAEGVLDFGGPMVIGVRRSVIILPREMADGWSATDLEPVLAHELAHVRRRDLLVNWMQAIAQTLYFFHPLVWLANRQIRRERELACDDLAVAQLEGRRADYSRSILKVIEISQRTIPMAVGIGMAECRSSLGRRIVRIMDRNYRTGKMSVFSFALMLALGGLCIVLASERTRAAQAAPAKPPVMPTAADVTFALPDPKSRDFEEAFKKRFDALIGNGRIEGFLGLQTLGRVMRMESVFAMLEGRPEVALTELVVIARAGQDMIQTGTLINRLIGIAVRSIAIGGMNFYVLNVSDAPGDLDRAWAQLEKLRGDYRSPDVHAMFSGEKIGTRGTRWNEQFVHSANAVEMMTRLRAVDAQFELLRVATAARARMLTAGSFPAEGRQFMPYFTTVPDDPFTSAPLKTVTAEESFVVYSVGPDKTDDRAEISYDPTNGTVSRGDLLIEVPRQRHYPIPAGGLHGTTAKDIDRQMPNGLPTDIFATIKGAPLNVVQTSTSLVMFSWGPDMNGPKPKEKTRPAENVSAPTSLDVQYDPTNGSVSRGDLIMTVPR